MLTIRAEQMAVFQEAADDAFVRDMVQHLGELFPARRGDASLPGLVRAGMAKARGYGIVTDRGIAVLVDLMVGVAPDFDEPPRGAWARDILRDGALPEDARVDMVVEILAAREAASEPAGEES